jgi:hypothetical protein
MTTKRSKNPEAIRARIEQMKAELAEAVRAENDRLNDEIIQIVQRAGIHQDVLAFARKRAAEVRGKRA